MKRKRPLTEDFDAAEMAGFVQELGHEAKSGSERATVLVASAAIDEWVRRRLYAITVDKEAAAALLADTATAPLGSFSARIQAAVAFGVLTPVEGRCLDKIRGIRNVYAHKLDHEMDRNSIEDKIGALCDEVDKIMPAGPIVRSNSLQRTFASAVLGAFTAIYGRHLEAVERVD